MAIPAGSPEALYVSVSPFGSVAFASRPAGVSPSASVRLPKSVLKTGGWLAGGEIGAPAIQTGPFTSVPLGTPLTLEEVVVPEPSVRP
jgi:hypothetical protein